MSVITDQSPLVCRNNGSFPSSSNLGFIANSEYIPVLSDEMLDSDDCTLALDGLFFDKPTVHEVKPLHQEVSPWQLEEPPSLTHIPATQDMQEEAESLSTLYSFSQSTNKFQPLFKGSAGLKVLPSTISSSCSLNRDKKETEKTKGGSSSSSTSQCDGLLGGEGFRDYSQGGCQSGRGGDETLQDSGHVGLSRWLSQDCSKSPPLRRSLFNIQVYTSGGDSLNTGDLSSSGGSSQPTSGLQTFHSQVTMATAPPPPLQPPQATVGRAAAPPFPSKPPLSPPPVGSSAASGRPPQQAPHAETQDKGTKKGFVPPMTPRPLLIQGSSGSGVLRPVSEIPFKFRSVFSEFPFFNYVQSKALDDVLYTNKNFVACAPTGSGKTVLFELAIIRLLMETPEPWRDVKAVYMAPIKALCSQCFESWKKKFGPLGLTCKELTGDTEIDDFFEIQDSHIILTTPEKWDSMTRKWKDNCLLQLVRLFLVDEVHVVKDATRGATLEVVVSRMKAVHAFRTSQYPEASLSMRFVAVSATIPNVSDMADWLSNENGPATYLDMDESHRPVKLRKVVLGFPCGPNQTEFKFDLSLNYKIANIIQTYSEEKPTLVFCSTRKGTQQSAAVLAKDARFIMSVEHKQRLIKYANSILDSKLRGVLLQGHMEKFQDSGPPGLEFETPGVRSKSNKMTETLVVQRPYLVALGVGYHHAGVDLSDRKLIEEVFTLGDLPVLFTTRTLSMGVNLPAHLVVIKSTVQYVAGSCEEYSEADLLQMIGRAGRPQFDTSATAVIMTKIQTREKYMKLMNGIEVIESSLHSHLVEHLNAEIVLQTITDVSMALDWIRSTFLYIRALKNPTHYGFSANLDRCGIEAKLQELCLKNLNSLSSVGLISMDEDITIKPTEAGRLMARYCVAFDTMKQFSKVSGTENLSDLIELLSKSREFSDIQLRVNEKRPLNALNRDKNRVTIRYSIDGKIKTSEMKVNCLIQAQLSSIPIQDFGLTQDTAKIFRIGMRISRCLSEFLSRRSKAGFSAVLNSLILAKCFRAKLWENSPYVSKQLEKIGQTLSTAMVHAGLTTFSKIEQTNARELELILNRHPPFGNQIRESVIHLPKYDVTVEQLPRYSSATAEIVLKVSLKNQAQLLTRRAAQDHHYVSVVIGDADNNVVFLQKLTNLMLLKGGSWSKKIDVAKCVKGEEISVHLISSEHVGLDIQQKFTVHYSAARRFGTENPDSITQDARRPQLVLKPLSTNQAATHRENGTSVGEEGSRSFDLANKRHCNHFCKNKGLCAHDCCEYDAFYESACAEVLPATACQRERSCMSSEGKVGVTVTRKRSANQETSFTSYLKDLRSRCDTFAPTPVKRLKVKMTEEPVSLSMQKFAYKPKEMLPPASWNRGNLCKASVRLQSGTDLASEAQLPDVESLNDLDGDYDDYYVEDMNTAMGGHSQTTAAAHPHHQTNAHKRATWPVEGNNAYLTPRFQHGSSVWTTTDIHVGSQNSEQDLNQVDTTSTVYSKSSTAVPEQAALCNNTSSIQIPTVTFDLGNEWDDWGDFDDDNLMHASEPALTSYTTAQPQIQQCDENSTPDHVTASAAVLLSSSHIKPSITAVATPLRSTLTNVSPEFKAGPSPVSRTLAPQKRLTFSWTPKVHRPNIFSEETTIKTPLELLKQPEEAKVTRRLDFFSALSAPPNASSSLNRSKEEEAFVGIFDGIF